MKSICFVQVIKGIRSLISEIISSSKFVESKKNNKGLCVTCFANYTIHRGQNLNDVSITVFWKKARNIASLLQNTEGKKRNYVFFNGFLEGHSKL